MNRLAPVAVSHMVAKRKSTATAAIQTGRLGKGFAAIVPVVKYLSERSRLATTHVRTIHDDMQKDTGAAVSAAGQWVFAARARGGKAAPRDSRPHAP